MRGSDQRPDEMWSYVSMEDRIPAEHPLRPLRRMVDRVLKSLSPRFATLYADTGRPSIPPERLLRALLIQVLYTIRSERLLMEQLDYNLLFRWFVGLSMDDTVWDATVFTKNRDRLLRGDIAEAFFAQVVKVARSEGLLSDEHFTVDGTLIEAWAGQKSFRKRSGEPHRSDDDPGNPTVDFHGEKRSNATHASTTDPEARLYKKTRGSEAKLAYLGHLLMENRNGLAVNAMVTEANGSMERAAALVMIQEVKTPRPITVGADKNFDTAGFVEDARRLNAVPHVAQNTRNRSSAIDGRTTRHSGYAISQRLRKRIEEIFGWMKTVGLIRKTRHRGRDRVGWMFVFTVAVYDLIRIRNLTGAGG
ncbi:MAG: IS5 family transposase [Candidatus Eisenbacteria bacterium]|nr:IS5 family transposase [Candidatus Eisenbacteria bacterium]